MAAMSETEQKGIPGEGSTYSELPAAWVADLLHDIMTIMARP